MEAIVRDVKGYLRESEGAEPDLNKLLNVEKLESFLKKMKDEKHYKPTTRTEKLQRINLFNCRLKKSCTEHLIKSQVVT